MLEMTDTQLVRLRVMVLILEMWKEVRENNYGFGGMGMVFLKDICWILRHSWCPVKGSLKYRNMNIRKTNKDPNWGAICKEVELIWRKST